LDETLALLDACIKNGEMQRADRLLRHAHRLQKHFPVRRGPPKCPTFHARWRLTHEAMSSVARWGRA